MDDETAHRIVQPSGENSSRHDKTRAHAARTAKKIYHYHHRQQRQRRLDITDEQESENHAGIAQERDEPASSRKKTNI
jgi:1,2-phenylacetyl-CoA epoxidase PaaB subunit